MHDGTLPFDPFDPPEELQGMMKGMHQIHAAAQMSGFPEKTATDIIVGILVSLMGSASEQKAEE